MKKFLITTIAFIVTIFSLSYVYAASNLATDTKDNTDRVANAIGNTANDAKNAVMNTKNTIANTATNAKNTVEETSKNMAGDVKNAANSMDNATYTAEQTAANNGFMGMSSTSWTWIILGIVGAVIVGLVWFYGRQYEHSYHDE